MDKPIEFQIRKPTVEDYDSSESSAGLVDEPELHLSQQNETSSLPSPPPNFPPAPTSPTNSRDEESGIEPSFEDRAIAAGSDVAREDRIPAWVRSSAIQSAFRHEYPDTNLSVSVLDDDRNVNDFQQALYQLVDSDSEPASPALRRLTQFRARYKKGFLQQSIGTEKAATKDVQVGEGESFKDLEEKLTNSNGPTEQLFLGIVA
ncbi:hypothetical protein N0V90_007521 [Kalmusia sp. IMI 367209]|nr:hypothetical protein N0V90_007521 [Kalmusia sp. IMI 367209]